MTRFSPKFKKKDRFENQNTSNQFTVIDMKYDKRLCDIVYKMQHCRNKFDMFLLPETVLLQNLDNGDYVAIHQRKQ